MRLLFRSPFGFGRPLPDVTPETWAEAFNASGMRWLLHITGGEPFLFRGFVNLCERLSEHHLLSLNTNLSTANVDEFAQRIDPSRVHFIHAALHWEQRESRAGALDRFVTNARLLQERGFTLIVSQVMTPDLFDRADSIAQRMESEGIAVVPKVLRGLSGGVSYPEAYTPDQVERLRNMVAAGRRAYNRFLLTTPERPTIDVFSDDHIFLDERIVYHGRSCDAGFRFVRIESDGAVMRCGNKIENALGNLLDGTFARRRTAEVCDTDFCAYFCEKYSGWGKDAAGPQPVRLSSATATASRHSSFPSFGGGGGQP